MRILYCSILSLTSRWYLCACLYYVDDLWCGYVLLHNTSCAVHRANRKVAGPSHSNCSLGTRIVSIEAQYWHSIEDADRKYWGDPRGGHIMDGTPPPTSIILPSLWGGFFLSDNLCWTIGEVIVIGRKRDKQIWMGLYGYTHPPRSLGIRALNMAPLDSRGGIPCSNVGYSLGGKCFMYVASLYNVYVADGIRRNMGGY